MSNDGPTKHFMCASCGEIWPDYETHEARDGLLYGPCCLLKTAERRAQARWDDRMEKP